MRWVLLWSVLLVLAGLFLTVMVRRFLRQVKALSATMSDASARMAAVSAGMRHESDR